MTLARIVLGALVTLGVRLPLAAAEALVGAFALFHGHAHGTELPEAASALGYAGGFVVATALLHGIGVAAGRALRRGAARPYLRLSGAAIAAVGILLIAF